MRHWKGVALIAVALILVVGCSGDPKIKTVNRDETGPVLIGAKFNPVNHTLTLRFNEAIKIDGSLADADFDLPVSGDNLGNGASFAIGSQEFDLVITLGTEYTLNADDDFQPSKTDAGDPSGIDVEESGRAKITDTSGNECQETPWDAFDIYDVTQ